jgi:hypothetical protein
LTNYFRVNFELTYSYKYALNDIENMMPWEREALLTLLNKRLDDEEQERKQRQQSL